MDNLIFVAMLLSKIEGISPTEEKFKTIMETRKPENVAELRIYLGLANYNSRFYSTLYNSNGATAKAD